MPIIGLTDRSPSFKECGRLRLGIPKSQMTSGPQEISYFRADFRPDAENAAAIFQTVYNEKPTRINVRFPFPEINRIWDAYYMVYNKSGLLGMADGQKWIYLRNNQTGELLVKDGFPTHIENLPLDGNGLPYLPFDKKVPVYSYKSKKNEDVAVYAKPEGRLKILVPELKEAAYMTVITHSIYNIMRLSEQLAGIEQLAKNAGMSLPMVPMVLSRRKEMISVSIDGKKSMQEHYLLNIEIDPTWMEAQWKFLEAILPGTIRPAMLQLPLPTPADLSENEPGEEPGQEQGKETQSESVSDDSADKLTIAEAVAIKTKKGNLLGSLSNDQLVMIMEKGEGEMQTGAIFLLQPASAEEIASFGQGLELPAKCNRIQLYREIQKARMP